MMQRYFICVDGINGYEEWHGDVADGNNDTYTTEDEMFSEVRQALKELGGGHADIFDADTDELYAEIEV